MIVVGLISFSVCACLVHQVVGVIQDVFGIGIEVGVETRIVADTWIFS